MGETPQARIAGQRIVYTTPAMDAVIVRRDETYRTVDGRALTMDIYYPSSSPQAGAWPAVIFVTGFPDAGAQRMLGRKFKEMGSFVSWAQLVAASGMAAITYENDAPVDDVLAVLQYVREHAADLRLDGRRLGVWACSGHVPNALALLMHAPAAVKCAVFCYGYLLDFDGSSRVADAARQFGFVTPCAGRPLSDLSLAVPLFIARAGRDLMPRLNDTLDRFVAEALASDLPLNLVNYSGAPHAFDLMTDADGSRQIIRQILRFMKSGLGLEE
jgi:dienelactone hydrolase